ncbi:MAG: hypothetical protein M5R36_27660 [Deltaproteobacteria bacterium]|nr:hypothetical protein [Deltaproteobacteria bacterium]
MSHIVPRFFFRRAKQFAKGDTLHRVDGESMLLSDRQNPEPLLCESCEATFGQWENYVSKISINTDLTFPAYENIASKRKSATHTYQIGDGAHISMGDVHKFALSVVWRASVSTQKDFSTVFLGPYESEARDFLIGSAAKTPNRCTQ